MEFKGIEECRPCAWMDQAFAPGAEQLLKGRGGLRARILSNGFLKRDLFVKTGGSKMENGRNLG